MPRLKPKSKTAADTSAPPAPTSKLSLQDDPARLISSARVRELLGGIAPMSLWRWRRREPTFPKPVVIAKRNYWRVAAIKSWIAERERAAIDAKR
jgi:predicted DNA-binding transcriptional regulator AlpA